MAITLEDGCRSAVCDAVVDLVDVGATPAWIELDSALGDILVIINLPNPSFGAASAGVATALGLPLTGTCILAGTLAIYRVYDRSGTSNLVWSGTIGTSAADMIVDSTTIVLGQAITITAWTHTHPA